MHRILISLNTVADLACSSTRPQKPTISCRMLKSSIQTRIEASYKNSPQGKENKRRIMGNNKKITTIELWYKHK